MAMSASGGADGCWSDGVEAVAVAVAGSGVFARERPGIFTMNTMVQGASVSAQACPPGLIRVLSMAQLVVVVIVDAMDEADDMWRECTCQTNPKKITTPLSTRCIRAA